MSQLGTIHLGSRLVFYCCFLVCLNHSGTIDVLLQNWMFSCFVFGNFSLRLNFHFRNTRDLWRENVLGHLKTVVFEFELAQGGPASFRLCSLIRVCSGSWSSWSSWSSSGWPDGRPAGDDHGAQAVHRVSRPGGCRGARQHELLGSKVA